MPCPPAQWLRASEGKWFRILILPGIEDFGMIAVDAQAAGRPMFTARRGGGALKSIINVETGWHFSPADDSVLIKLLRWKSVWDTRLIQAYATTFSQPVFEGPMGRTETYVLAAT